jgi:hypothetical protein
MMPRLVIVTQFGGTIYHFDPITGDPVFLEDEPTPLSFTPFNPSWFASPTKRGDGTLHDQPSLGTDSYLFGQFSKREIHMLISGVVTPYWEVDLGIQLWGKDAESGSSKTFYFDLPETIRPTAAPVIDGLSGGHLYIEGGSKKFVVAPKFTHSDAKGHLVLGLHVINDWWGRLTPSDFNGKEIRCHFGMIYRYPRV